MEFTIKIPTLTQLTTFAAWDQSIGVFLALVIAGLVGAHLVLNMVFSGFLGGRRNNTGWMFANAVIGCALSLYTLSASGSWLAGCLVALVSWVVLASFRVRMGG